MLQVGLFNNLSANVLTFDAATFATIGVLTMSIVNQDNRHNLSKAQFFSAGFLGKVQTFSTLHLMTAL